MAALVEVLWDVEHVLWGPIVERKIYKTKPTIFLLSSHWVYSVNPSLTTCSSLSLSSLCATGVYIYAVYCRQLFYNLRERGMGPMRRLPKIVCVP
jgi:hypothetical protein